MHYELWHIPSGNLVSTYAHEDDALAVVRRALRQRGRAHAEEFALGTEDRRGRSRAVASGGDLVARAEAAEARENRRTA
jgi:hypothetical protein